MTSGNDSNRPLTAGEIAGLPPGLIAAVPVADVRLAGRHHPGSRASELIGRSALIVVRGRRIFWPHLGEDMSGDRVAMSLLAHELVHVWQYETGMTLWRYVLRALVQGQYAYAFEPGKAFTAYGYEQQAAMVEDWVRLMSGLAPHWSCNRIDKAMLESVVPFAR